MRIVLNGQEEETSAATLAELVAERGYQIASVATACAGEFVPREAREGCDLHPGIVVDVLVPMQGG